MTSLKIIIVINCASMKLQVKFKQKIITFQTFWLKTGGRGALIPEGVLIGRRALNQIIVTCKQFCCHYLRKVNQYFTYSWRKTAKVKQTLLDNFRAPKLIIFKIENLSTCLKKKKLQRHLWIIINLLIVGNCSKCCWKVLNTHECWAKYKCNIINLLYF